MSQVILYSGVSSGDTCYSALTSNTFYLTSPQIDIGVTAFTDALSAETAPNGFYRGEGTRPIWGEITNNDGVFSVTGICYECCFTGFTILVQGFTTFVDCCNPGHFFNLIYDLGTFEEGQTYYVNTGEFVGCATVVELDICYPVYSTIDAEEEVDCESCLTNNSITCPENICEVTYIIINTNGLTEYDDTYVIQGSSGYNNYNYFISQNSPTYYIFFDETKWCLSDSLGGECLLFGNEQCYGTCPDFCDIETWTCTTTTENPCDIVDFEAIFECDPTPTLTPTPSVTPTNPPTPTPSPTPTSTCICCSTSMSLSGSTFGPTPSPTPTPSQTPPPCFDATDEITHILISSPFECPPTLG
jgi:hypothetical protein